MRVVEWLRRGLEVLRAERSPDDDAGGELVAVPLRLGQEPEGDCETARVRCTEKRG